MWQSKSSAGDTEKGCWGWCCRIWGRIRSSPKAWVGSRVWDRGSAVPWVPGSITAQQGWLCPPLGNPSPWDHLSHDSPQVTPTFSSQNTLFCVFYPFPPPRSHLILPLIPLSDSALRLRSLCNLEKHFINLP